MRPLRMPRWLRPPRKLSFTREGKFFVGIALGIGFAAINTGNNLLYLLLGMMLSLIITSGILAELSLRGLTVERLPPSRIFADRPFLMGIDLRNAKRYLSSFSLEVEDLGSGQVIDKRCFFFKLPASRRQQTSYRQQLPHRGRYGFLGFRLLTRFPFGFFCKSMVIDASSEVIVFPAVYPIVRAPHALRSSMGDDPSGRRGRQGEFYGLRDFREGDDARDIHWPSSARAGHGMVREQEVESARRMTLYIDNARPEGISPAESEFLAGFERAISMTASLALHYLARGLAVRIVARDSASPWAMKQIDDVALLRYLALLSAVSDDKPFVLPANSAHGMLLITRRGSHRPPGQLVDRLEA